jgi:hypothetical protein
MFSERGDDERNFVPVSWLRKLEKDRSVILGNTGKRKKEL